MIWIQGWPITYVGIVLLGIGCWIGGGPEAGLGVTGLCLMLVGAAQLYINQ